MIYSRDCPGAHSSTRPRAARPNNNNNRDASATPPPTAYSTELADQPRTRGFPHRPRAKDVSFAAGPQGPVVCHGQAARRVRPAMGPRSLHSRYEQQQQHQVHCWQILLSFPHPSPPRLLFCPNDASLPFPAFIILFFDETALKDLPTFLFPPSSDLTSSSLYPQALQQYHRGIPGPR